MSKTMTVITMYVYHDGIDDTEILSTARYFSENIETSLWDGLEEDEGEVTVPVEQVTVATAPFKVE
tara:strand:- start:2139 stop:2336 length:198 start_codon:yes stop_codon:yes gene_type:complete